MLQMIVCNIFHTPATSVSGIRVAILHTVKTGNFAVGEVISPSAKKIFGADG